MTLFHIPHLKKTSEAPKQFVDYQNDVTAAGIELACREGFESIEHVKRYTALGFGTDQGKLGNIAGMAIAAKATGRTIPETGTTIFRPNYTPVTFGAMVGRDRGELFDPKRYTAMHKWHVENGALFEDVGQWKRPWYFPKAGETMQQALDRECKATRESVVFWMRLPSVRSIFRVRTHVSSSAEFTPMRGRNWPLASVATV